MGLKKISKDENTTPAIWSTCKLNDLIDSSRPIRYGVVQPGQFYSAGCLMLRSQDYSRGWTDDTKMHRINPALEKQFENARILSGDMVVTIVGAGIGQIVKTPEWLNRSILSRSTARVSIDEQKANPDFVFHFLSSDSGQTQMKQNVKEGAQPVISSKDLGNCLIPCLPRPEQNAIATALSDADALITSLEKLIAKKRLIKQGVMQKLLEPKKGWEVKRLGDVLKVRHGKSQHEVVTSNGKYPILATSGVVGYADRYLYQKPSVLIGRKGTIDVPQFMESPFWSIDTLFYTEINDQHDARFLFYLFTTIDWYAYNEASGVPSLSAKTIENIERSFPKNKNDEIEISKTIRDFDKEIVQFERKLSKAKMLKQGMMQTLLTGKIRLV